MSTGPLSHSRTVRASGLCQLDHSATPELSVQVDYVNWTTQPLPNCQCKWTMSTGPLSHSRTVSASGLCQLDHPATPELSVQVDYVNWTTQPLPNCQCKWTMSTGPLSHSRTVSASGLCQLDHSRTVSASGLCKLDHSATPKLSVQVDYVNWTTQPLPNCQYKWTMTSRPLGHSRAASPQHNSSTCLHKHLIVHL